MYLEADSEETERTPATLIKEISFTCRMPDYGTFCLKHPPFIMSTWCQGVVNNMTVECVVTYEATVEKPKSTRFLYQLDGESPGSCQKSVSLALNIPSRKPVEAWSAETVPMSNSHQLQVTNSTVSQSAQSVWTNNFNAVQLPPSRSQPGVWASVVAGKKQSKPIPGSTQYLFPELISPHCNVNPVQGHCETGPDSSFFSSNQPPDTSPKVTDNPKMLNVSFSGEDVGSSLASNSCESGHDEHSTCCSQADVYKSSQLERSGHDKEDKSYYSINKGSDSNCVNNLSTIVKGQDVRPRDVYSNNRFFSEPNNKSDRPLQSHGNYRRAFSGGNVTSRNMQSRYPEANKKMRDFHHNSRGINARSKRYDVSENSSYSKTQAYNDTHSGQNTTPCSRGRARGSPNFKTASQENQASNDNHSGRNTTPRSRGRARGSPNFKTASQENQASNDTHSGQNTTPCSRGRGSPNFKTASQENHSPSIVYEDAFQ